MSEKESFQIASHVDCESNRFHVKEFSKNAGRNCNWTSFQEKGLFSRFAITPKSEHVEISIKCSRGIFVAPISYHQYTNTFNRELNYFFNMYYDMMKVEKIGKIEYE